VTRSLRHRLLVRAGVAIAAVFGVLAAVLYFSVRAWLIAEVDRGLLAEAEALKSAAEFHDGNGPGGGITIDFDGGQPSQFIGNGAHAHFYQLWAGQTPVAASPSLAGQNLPWIPSSSGQPQFTFVRAPGGVDARQISLAFVAIPKPEETQASSAAKTTPVPLTLLVASDASELFKALARLRALLIVACGTAVLASLGLLAISIRRGLAPVDQVADRIGRVGRANLSERLDPSEVPRELQPVVERLNEMLARLQAAFERERAFTADVAHELRTPLAGLETALEVCGSRPRQPPEYQQVIGRSLTVTRQMHAMVDSLLTLSRADAGTLAVTRESFCLQALFDDMWAPFADLAVARSLKVTRSVEVGRPVRSDRQKLAQIIQNLFENAVEYCDDGGSIILAATASDSLLRLNVSNTGSKLSQEHADQATARFWRGDPARSHNRRHCGLGLAIVRELVVTMKGQIHVASRINGEFRVEIELPS
jgi:signal transduction histidine kinase